MNQFKELAENLSKKFEKNALYLCELDTKAGDGDHGLTISRGFNEAQHKVSLMQEDSKPADICKEIGYAMLSSMGGASGPIFSTFFIQAAIVLKDKNELTSNDFAKIIEETIKGISHLAETKRGEKTMVDALYGAQDELSDDGQASLEETLDLALKGARKGAEATIDMVAMKGRAHFLGERSRGFMDAGSWSVYLMLESIKETFTKEC